MLRNYSGNWGHLRITEHFKTIKTHKCWRDTYPPPPHPPPPQPSIATAMIRCYGQLIISHYFQSIVKLSQCPAVEIKINVNLFLLHEVTRIATRGVCNCLPVVRLTRSQIYSFRPSVSRSAEFWFGQCQH